MADTSSADAALQRAQQAINAALNSPLPRFYANSFISAGSPSDILTVFQCNGQNICTLNLNFITAKTLAISLTNMIADYEKNNNLTIPTMDIASQQVSAE
jgi:hypothetical protein